MTKEQLDKGVALTRSMSALYPALQKVRAAVDERKQVLSVVLAGGDIDTDTLPDEAGQAMLMALHDTLAKHMQRLETEFSEL